MNAADFARPELARLSRGRPLETTPLSPALLPLLDAGFLVASLWMVYWIEMSSNSQVWLRSDFLRLCLWVVPLKLVWLAMMGEYRHSVGRWETSRWSRIWMGLLAGSGASAVLSSIAPPAVVLSAS